MPRDDRSTPPGPMDRVRLDLEYRLRLLQRGVLALGRVLGRMTSWFAPLRSLRQVGGLPGDRTVPARAVTAGPLGRGAPAALVALAVLVGLRLARGGPPAPIESRLPARRWLELRRRTRQGLTSQLRRSLALALEARDERSGALTLLREVAPLTRDSGDPRTHRLIARMLLSGQPGPASLRIASRHLNRASEAAPRDDAVRVSLVRALARHGQYSLAMRTLDPLAEPSEATHWLAVDVLRQAADRAAQQRTDGLDAVRRHERRWLEALRRAPDRDRVARRIVRAALYQLQGDDARALALLRRRPGDAPDRTLPEAVQRELGRCLAHAAGTAGVKDPRSLFERAARLRTPHPEVRTRLTALAARPGDAWAAQLLRALPPDGR